MAEHVWQDYRLNSSTAARYYFPSTSTTYCENSAFVCQACAAERFFKSISTTGPACVWTSVSRLCARPRSRARTVLR
ncbi:hypothetical protein PR001_g24097 [Phytophthora rubi]|uniref:Uncharacterized protein n=1 Tax=Phytophthora rubi TaxID=129364 RepID=A0A6A3IDJ2_9STRA|nr:hypothetical protein PR001_g24097 [Phytophthora rubi]